MTENPTQPKCSSDQDPVLLRTLVAAGLPLQGGYRQKSGWVSRAWVGDDYVVRVSNGLFRDAYLHESRVVQLLDGSGVPHARHIAHGEGPDGPWYVSERLPGRTLQEVWPTADTATKQKMIESLGAALRALHQINVPGDLLPPWMLDAFNGGPRLAYHPPVIGAALGQVEAAKARSGGDDRLLVAVDEWIRDRLDLFTGNRFVLVHGDLHGSNIMVDDGRVTGLIDFAEAVTQPADVELDTILRWCARSVEYPSSPDAVGLDASTLADVPGWLRRSYPELFAHNHLHDRLLFFDMLRELALYSEHPQAGERRAAQARITRLLDGHNHLDALIW